MKTKSTLLSKLAVLFIISMTLFVPLTYGWTDGGSTDAPDSIGDSDGGPDGFDFDNPDGLIGPPSNNPTDTLGSGNTPPGGSKAPPPSVNDENGDGPDGGPDRPNRCDDGTRLDRCSSQKPLFCTENGNLVNRASECGCPANKVRNGNQCVEICPAGKVEHNGVCRNSCPAGTVAKGRVCVGTCSDGTQLNSCASPRPLYCNSNGNLVNNARECGCPAGETRVGNRCEVVCSDGTIAGSCSTNRPFFCTNSGNLIQRGQACGCPAGETFSNGACRPVCTDGTIAGSCSTVNPSFRCNGNGDLVQRAQSCGCPAGQVPLNPTSNRCVNPNPPVITIVPDQTTFEVNEGEDLSFDVIVTDADGDRVTLSRSALPPGATFVSPRTNHYDFEWTPGFDDEGTYQITFTADDTAFTATRTVTIIVGNTNRAPLIQVLGQHIVEVGEKLVIMLSGSDPDGDSVRFGLDSANKKSRIVGDEFEIVPGRDQAGMEYVAITLSDGDLVSTQIVPIQVVRGEVDRFIVRGLAFPDGEVVERGEDLRVLVNLENDGNVELRDISVRAFIKETGKVISSAKFDLEPDYIASRVLKFPIPENMEPGHYYMGFELGNQDTGNLKYRPIEVI